MRVNNFYVVFVIFSPVTLISIRNWAMGVPQLESISRDRLQLGHRTLSLSTWTAGLLYQTVLFWLTSGNYVCCVCLELCIWVAFITDSAGRFNVVTISQPVSRTLVFLVGQNAANQKPWDMAWLTWPWIALNPICKFSMQKKMRYRILSRERAVST